VKLSVDSAVSSPGESVSVPILAALGSQGMGAATIELAFDPEILKVTACTSDPEVALDFGVCHVEPQSGLVRLAGIASGGVSGNPVLAEISFEVVGESRGHSNLELTAYTFTDTAGQTIEVKVRNGRIRVVPARPARRPSR
jgi:hypothetical protein